MPVGSTCTCNLPGKCRININFLVKKSATKVFQILTKAYGDKALSRPHIFEWYKRFSGGRVSAEDDEPSGCPRSHYSATRRLLVTDHVILNHDQVTSTIPELAPPLLTTTPQQWEDVSALDRFNVHRCPTRRVFSGTGLELMT
ncbi:uncharacterized protein TNCV_2903881 [Trichonephila clavipes]|nr:uncharacterized protein TNCV_2903881 [Trichonephila clavipes]